MTSTVCCLSLTLATMVPRVCLCRFPSATMASAISPASRKIAKLCSLRLPTKIRSLWPYSTSDRARRALRCGQNPLGLRRRSLHARSHRHLRQFRAPRHRGARFHYSFPTKTLECCIISTCTDSPRECNSLVYG